MKIRLAILAVALCANTAYAENKTNFGYTALGVAFASLNYSPPIDVTLSGTTYSYSGLSGVGLSGAYQFDDNLNWLVLSLTGQSVSATTGGLKLSGSLSTVGVAMVKPISTKVDIGVGIDSLSSTTSLTAGNTSVSVSSNGSAFWVGGKGWLNDDKNLAASATVTSSQYNGSSSSSYSLGLNYYVSKEHEVRLGYGSSSGSGSTSTSLVAGYQRHFN